MPGRPSRYEGETTRLPYLINAALNAREKKVELDSWTTLTFAEERQEGEQNSLNSSKNSFAGTKDKKIRLKRGKKQVRPLSPGIKHCDAIDATGGCVPALPALDERVLILCHSSLRRTWKRQQQQQANGSSLPHYAHEASHAATQIQKIFRGVAARTEWRAFYCLRNQHAASLIQFAYRRAVVRRRVFSRLVKKRMDRATQIQAWYRGHRCRDLLLYQHIRLMHQRIANFQRYIRGRRLWRIVMAILHRRRCNMATEIQRCYRGRQGRLRAIAIRYEQNRHVRALIHQNEIHAHYSRCEGCKLESCTEDSLFQCFMVRYIGLHDFKGAKTLCEDGLRLFPSSFKFVFFFSVLLQVMCEDVETCMAFLKRAKEIGIVNEELSECETRFYQPAHLLRPDDAQLFLDSAVLCQYRDQLPRAEANYVKALELPPQEYAVPGYLHRMNLVDRLLVNYHRFCSLFNFRQVNVMQKEIFTAKKGKKVRMMVSKLNHYTAIIPTDNRSTCRINTLYLTDEELRCIINLTESEGECDKENASNTSKSVLDNNVNPSMRQTSARPASKEMTSRITSSNVAIPQLYQQEFVGLAVQPSTLARFSEARSKLRLTKPAAEILLNALVFVDPVGSHTELANQEGKIQQDESVLEKVMLIPSILKMRQQLRSTIVNSYAAVDVQRVYRGFRLRADVRRKRFLNDIRQKQVDEMYRLLHENYLHRELRRSSAVAIQKIFKGYAFRKLLHRWRSQAGEIQRIFRGYRGRLRAAAFRDGTCTFYMAQRIFQRGMDISGRRVMLVIEKCGLSFRLDGYDLKTCVTYHGFFSHSSSIALLCYLNWTYAESLLGRELTRKGDKIEIRSVSSINQSTGECFVDCVGSTSTVFTIPLAECVQIINLRAMTSGIKNSLMLAPPISGDDATRLAEAVARRTILVPAIHMATQELKAKASANFTISVQPPPRMHFIYQQSSHARGTPLHTSSSSALQFAYPASDGLRGKSIGTTNFRKKCTRHAVQFIRCRCILPIVSTSAHVETISRALVLPGASSNL
ncbi:hypothetical protein PHMEG_0009990 [Phytophthora megakarya]|uniref:Uncharacterized protein n=1 Tax=Phytophthora megakarya TaxID=4795 RepID=A0A225WET7_9STRA|nr:hypothetical protein PHMEG_0009990 [Phytophthora megakarya]